MYFSAFVASSTAIPTVLVGFGLGIGFLFWALLSLRRHRRVGGRISFFIFSLLLTDVLEMILLAIITVIYMTVFWGNEEEEENSGQNPALGFPYVFFVVCLALMYFRLCGCCFHQLVALEGILTLTNSDGTTGLSSPRASIPVSVILWVWGVVCVYFTFNQDQSILMLASYLACVVLAIASAIITCLKANAQSSRPTRKQILRVLSVALVTLALLYGPVFTCVCLYAMGLPQGEFFYIAAAIMNFSLVTDPLLCVLVFWKRQTSTVNDRLDMSVVGA
ncbi:hypothetical protein ACEWY4_024745 [Coilia grayii]|uniref:G-protein coupled receptors family 1 profile domain-containing protein n=1 Tax=Coilia grayii TaxID=363190 RepID=A0ABD1IVM5_9TELE